MLKLKASELGKGHAIQSYVSHLFFFFFFLGVVDVATEDSNKDVLISATRFDRQLTGEVRCRRIVAGNSTDEGGAVEGGRV